MPIDVRLEDVADSLLTNLATKLTEAGIDVPTRQYIQAGDVAHDFAGQNCAEAFVITWDGNFQGVVGQGVGNLTNAPIICSMPLVAQFTVALLRCVPVVKVVQGKPKAPAMDELDASGRRILQDAMTLANVTVKENVDLLPDSMGQSGLYQVGIGNLLPVGPLGGVGGTSMTVLVGMV